MELPPMPNFKRNCVCVTIATRNYLHRALSLASHFQALMEGSKVLVVVVDGVPDHLDVRNSSIDFVVAESLGIPRFRSLTVALNATALCCMLKPFAVLLAFQKYDCDSVLYVDNDILLLQPPTEMLEELKDASLCLTPHLLRPPTSECGPSISQIIPYGVFNAGMFAASRNEECLQFLQWWGGYMCDPRRIKGEQGYDQVWLSYAPCFCQNVKVVMHPGYNVAYWNICDREISCVGGKYLCNAENLVAFHFSHFDENDPDQLVSGDCFPKLEINEHVRSLMRLAANDWGAFDGEQIRSLGYRYSSWDNRSTITEAERAWVCEQWDELDDSFGRDYSSQSMVLQGLRKSRNQKYLGKIRKLLRKARLSV